jgi:hypothetical protein
MTRRPVSRAAAAERRLRARATLDAALSAAGWAAQYGPPAPASEQQEQVA